MHNALDPRSVVSAELQEKVLLGGDLARLSVQERLSYYNNVCLSLELNPLTRPFEYLTLNGKTVLYARKDCTEQLRSNRHISVQIISREVVEGVYVVTARASMPHGEGLRVDESIGAVPIDKVQGEARANAMMKGETKAKRRVTLSICGLGMLDETEIDSIPGARVVSHEPAVNTREGAAASDALVDVQNAQLADVQAALQARLAQPLTAATPLCKNPGAAFPGETLGASVPGAAFIWRVGAKHKNESLSTIDRDYLVWYEKEGKVADHVAAAKQELDRRLESLSTDVPALDVPALDVPAPDYMQDQLRMSDYEAGLTHASSISELQHAWDRIVQDKALLTAERSGLYQEFKRRASVLSAGSNTGDIMVGG